MMITNHENGAMASTYQKPYGFKIIDPVLLAAIWAFLLCYFEPADLFSLTTTTGGDTASHYYTAQYLKDQLLPAGRISGWCPGNLAGFPILQNYFPLPFVLMAGLSILIPLQIAFKLVTVLGVFLLPPCTYLFLRCLRQPFPVPVIGALLSLPFLFMEGQSMWGGNIPSTLAGTFCYSLGFALSILWLGWLYRTMATGRGWGRCSLLLAAVGFCHGYCLLFAGTASLFFLLNRDVKVNFRRLIRIHALAAALMAFWLLPLMAYLPFTTRFSILWIFQDWGQVSREVGPRILYPGLVLTVLAAVFLLSGLFRRRGRTTAGGRPGAFVGFMLLVSLGLYAIGNRVGVVDIRFLPYFQFFIAIGGALLFSLWWLKRLAGSLLALACGLGLFLWVDTHETFIYNWIHANYRGFENRLRWPEFEAVNRHNAGSFADSRVVYEHSQLHRQAGSVRAFESIPHFSGRATLEGVYIQASLCVPFAFYLQSEISQKPSTPIPDYCYGRFDLERAVDHMRLFNVGRFITVEADTRRAAAEMPALRHSFQAGPYDVFDVTVNSGRYVESLRFKPVIRPRAGWRREAYRWFRLGDLEVPLVFAERISRRDREFFIEMGDADVRRPPRLPLEADSALKEIVGAEEIRIEGAAPGVPLLVKVSYHPNWRVEGADRIYLASPAFMLIVPRTSAVRLFYGRGWPEHAGAAVSVAALLFLVACRRPQIRALCDRVACGFNRYGLVPTTGVGAALLLALGYYLIWHSPEFPVLAYNRGLEHFTREEYDTARTYFKRVMQQHPQTLVVDQAGYHHAMCSFRQGDWAATLQSLGWLLENYPDSRRMAEVRYHMGLCHLNSREVGPARRQFEITQTRFPATVWSRLAGERLQELNGP